LTLLLLLLFRRCNHPPLLSPMGSGCAQMHASALCSVALANRLLRRWHDVTQRAQGHLLSPLDDIWEFHLASSLRSASLALRASSSCFTAEFSSFSALPTSANAAVATVSSCFEPKKRWATREKPCSK